MAVKTLIIIKTPWFAFHSMTFLCVYSRLLLHSSCLPMFILILISSDVFVCLRVSCLWMFSLRLQKKCQEVLFLSCSKRRKAEELLWKHVVYGVISQSKQHREVKMDSITFPPLYLFIISLSLSLSLPFLHFFSLSYLF